MQVGNEPPPTKAVASGDDRKAATPPHLRTTTLLRNMPRVQYSRTKSQRREFHESDCQESNDEGGCKKENSEAQSASPGIRIIAVESSSCRLA